MVFSELLDEHPDHSVFLRFAVAPTGRLSIAEVFVAAPTGLQGEVVRRLTLGRWEAWANDPAHGWLREIVERSAPGFNPCDPADRAQMSTYAPMLLGVDLGGVLSGPLDVSEGEPTAAVVRRSEKRPTKRQLRLPDPGQGVTRKGDDFYRKVATAYSRAAVHGRPAVQLAEANDVPVTTVHRWVKEARRRSLLAPGERRKRGERP